MPRLCCISRPPAREMGKSIANYVLPPLCWDARIGPKPSAPRAWLLKLVRPRQPVGRVAGVQFRRRFASNKLSRQAPRPGSIGSSLCWNEAHGCTGQMSAQKSWAQLPIEPAAGRRRPHTRARLPGAPPASQQAGRSMAQPTERQHGPPAAIPSTSALLWRNRPPI